MKVDLSNAWKSAIELVNRSISLLPNLVLALFVFLLFLIFASLSKSFITRFSLRHHSHKSLALLLGRLTRTCVVILGILVSLSIVAPSFQLGDLIKMLGIGSVAIGFAFQNILQNFLAGILILAQEPFQLGDWINVTGLEGRVEDIQARATIIIQKDGRRVVIPNAVIFTNPVTVGELPKPPAPAPAATPATAPGT